MGSVYPRHRKLWIKFKDADGKWVPMATPFEVGQEALARKLLKKYEDRVAAGEAVTGKQGPLTVAMFASKWLEERKTLGIQDADGDAARYRMHLAPVLGKLEMAEVRPRHVRDAFVALRARKKLAPKTIRNVYSVARALFRDAQIAGLLEQNPCILTKYQLGENVDKDPEWRATAIYTRAELIALVSSPLVPWDRRVLYALEGIGGLRHGEAAGLRWRHVDLGAAPLGKLTVATSYDRGQTKTQLVRFMPVHPALGRVLSEWQRRGWAQQMGRRPVPDDLVVPLPAPTNRGRRVAFGGMRTKSNSGKRLKLDLAALGLRHRRGHDLRRTLISLARADGARKDLLELCTHTPRKRERAIDVYSEFPFEVLCVEVAKLKLEWPLSPKTGEPTLAPGETPGSKMGQVLDSSSILGTGLGTATANPLDPNEKSSGGAGNRTRVREPSTLITTCVAPDLYSRKAPMGRIPTRGSRISLADHPPGEVISQPVQ